MLGVRGYGMLLGKTGWGGASAKCSFSITKYHEMQTRNAILFLSTLKNNNNM